MIVDSSVLVAIVRDEPGAEILSRALARGAATMSVANWLEASMVLGNHSDAGRRALDDVVDEAGIVVVPVTVEHGVLARDAHQRYGRGSGSRARLNYGDCYAYALAVESGQPLLFKGDDFTHTDVRPALN